MVLENKQFLTEDSNGSMIMLDSAVDMALTGGKLTASPRSPGYEVFPARRWRIIVCETIRAVRMCKCLIGFAVAIIVLGARYITR